MIKKLLFTMALILVCQFSNAQFALGDIAFSAYNADSTVPIGTNDDAFTIVLLRDVVSGEQISFTENGWFAAGGFRSGESTLTLEFTSAYTEGTQVSISRTPFVALDQNNAVAGTLTGSGLSLATGGDQIFAYNPSNMPIAGNETGFIAAIHMNGDWDADATSSTTSAKPNIFTDGMNSISINPEVDNARFAPANCSITDIASLRTALNTASNWEVNGAMGFSQVPPACNFVNTLSIDEQVFLENTVKLSPNPVNNAFGVVMQNTQRLSNLEIFDITGKQVFNISKITEGETIDVSTLSAGVYLVKLNFENNTVIKKLVKN